MLVARVLMLYAIILGPVPVVLADPAANALPTLSATPPVNANVNTAGDVMTVTQTGAQAQLEWTSFDVGSAATVNFVQNATDVAINQITDVNPSQIFGALNADGTVYLLNPNGFVFGAGCAINTAALVATTAEQIDLGTLALSDFGSGTIVDLAGIKNDNAAGTIALLADGASAQIAAGGTATLTAAQVDLLSGKKVELANIAGGTFTIQLDTSNIGDKTVDAPNVGLDVALPADVSFASPVSHVDVLGDTNGASIQDAIDVVSAGGTITVADGTYAEDLVIDKGLSLQSENGSGTTTIDLQDGVGIDIQADGVTLGGSLDHGFGIVGGGATTFAVQLPNGPDGTTISYNSIDISGGGSQGISVGAAGASNLAVEYNSFLAGDGDGAIWAPDLVDSTIAHNTFNTLNDDQQASGYAIEVAGVTGSSFITDNKVYNYANGVFLIDGTGISSLKVTDNEIVGCLTGLRTYTGYGVGAGIASVTVEDNTFTDNDRQVYDQGGVFADFAALAAANHNMAGAWVSGGNTIYSSLQDARADGSDLVVNAGTYSEDLTFDADTTITGVNGALSLTGTTTINGDVALTLGSGLTLGNVVSTDAANELTLALGTYDLSVGQIGDDTTAFESLTVNGTGDFRLGGNVYTDGNTQTYNAPFVLTSNVTLADASGSIAFNNTIDGAYGLTVNAGDAVTFSQIGGTTPLASLGVDAGGAVGFNGAAEITGTLSVTAGDAITQTGAVTAGATTLDAGTHAITLENADNSFGDLTVTGGTVSITESGDITDGGAWDTGATTLKTLWNGTGNIELDNAGNSFGALTLTSRNATDTANAAGAVDVVEDGDTELASVQTTGTLSVKSNGTITQTGALAAGATTLDAGTDDITLINTDNQLGDLTVTGGTVAITEKDQITDGGAWNTGATTLTADDGTRAGLNITLNNASSTTGSLTLNGAVATVDRTAAIDIAGGTVGTLNLTSGEGITDSGTITVTNGASLTTDVANKNIEMDQIDVSGGTVALTTSGTGAATLDNDHGVNLAASNVGGQLSVTANGDITQSGPVTAGATTLDADTNNITLTNINNQFGDLTVTGDTVAITEKDEITDGGAWNTGATTLTADSNTRVALDITLDNASSTTGSLTLNGAVATVDRTAAIDIAGGTVGTLNLTSGEGITDSGTITVTNGASLTTDVDDKNIEMDQIDVSSGSVALTTSGTGAATLDNDHGVDLAASTVGGQLSVTANGAITQSGAVAAGATTLDADTNDITLENAGNTFGDLTVTGDTVAITESGDITDGGAWDTGATTLKSLWNGTGDITLDNAGNSFGALTLKSRDATDSATAAGTITVVENDPTELASVETTGDLRVTSSGAITDLDSASLAVGGQATFMANGDVTLGDANNDQANFGSVVATGDNVQITENSAMVIDGLDAGAATLTANGTITDSDNAITTVTTVATLDAGGNDITLGDTGTDQVNFGSLDATGGNVTITENSEMVIDALDAGTAALTAEGTITDSASADIAVGTASFTAVASDIVLDAAGSTTGALTLTGANVTLQNYEVNVEGTPDTLGILVNATGNALLEDLDFLVDNGDQYVHLQSSANDPIDALLHTWDTSTFNHGVVLTNEVPILYSTLAPAFQAASDSDALADLEVWIEGGDYGNEAATLNGAWDTISFHGMTGGAEDGNAVVSFQTLEFGVDTTASVYATNVPGFTQGLQLNLQNLWVRNLNGSGQVMRFNGAGQLTNSDSWLVYRGGTNLEIRGYVYWGGDRLVGPGDRIADLAFTDAARPDYFPTDSFFLTRFLSADGSAGTGLYSIDFVDFGKAKVTVDNPDDWPVTINPSRRLGNFEKEFQANQ